MQRKDSKCRGSVHVLTSEFILKSCFNASQRRDLSGGYQRLGVEVEWQEQVDIGPRVQGLN